MSDRDEALRRLSDPPTGTEKIRITCQCGAWREFLWSPLVGPVRYLCGTAGCPNNTVTSYPDRAT